MHVYQQLNLKNKVNTNIESWIQRVFWWLRDGVGCQGMGEEVRVLRSTNRYLQNSHGDVKYRRGNGVAKELRYMTHGYEQWCGDCLREWGKLCGERLRGKNQVNCNNIIKYFFRKLKVN